MNGSICKVFRSAGSSIIVAVVLFCLGIVPTARHAHAAPTCSVSESPPLFGSVNTSTNQNFNILVLYAFNCFGSANENMIVCLTNMGSANGGVGNSGPYFMMSGSNKLNYNVYSDSGYSVPLKVGGPGVAFAFTLGSNGNSLVSDDLYFRIPSGQTTALSGNYSTTIAIQVKIGDAATLTSSCNGAASQTGTLNQSVTATIPGSCTLTGGALNFGSAGFLTSNIDAMATITPNCSNGWSFTISLDGGQHGGTTATNRKMVNGANSVLYGLFSDVNRSVGWFGASASMTGTGANQPVSVYGRVAPQTTPPFGTYTDTVVITVTY